MNAFLHGFFFVVIVPLLIAVVSAWLIGRMVFSLLEKKSAKTANSVALIVVQISQLVIWFLLMWATSALGYGFSR